MIALVLVLFVVVAVASLVVIALILRGFMRAAPEMAHLTGAR